jgi:hypothetical protein
MVKFGVKLEEVLERRSPCLWRGCLPGGISLTLLDEILSRPLGGIKY